MSYILHIVFGAIVTKRVVWPYLPRPERALVASTNPFTMATLSTSLRGEKIVVIPSLEDVRPFRYTRQRFSDKKRLRGGVSCLEIDGANVDSEILEVDAWRAMKLSAGCRKVYGSIIIPEELCKSLEPIMNRFRGSIDVLGKKNERNIHLDQILLHQNIPGPTKKSNPRYCRSSHKTLAATLDHHPVDDNVQSL